MTLEVFALTSPAAAESCDLFGEIKSVSSAKPVTIIFFNAGDRLQFSASLNGSLFFQDLTSRECSPGLFTTGVYKTAFLGGGQTSVITVYGTTVAALAPLVEYTL